MRLAIGAGRLSMMLESHGRCSLTLAPSNSLVRLVLTLAASSRLPRWSKSRSKHDWKTMLESVSMIRDAQVDTAAYSLV